MFSNGGSKDWFCQSWYILCPTPDIWSWGPSGLQVLLMAAFLWLVSAGARHGVRIARWFRPMWHQSCVGIMVTEFVGFWISWLQLSYCTDRTRPKLLLLLSIEQNFEIHCDSKIWKVATINGSKVGYVLRSHPQRVVKVREKSIAMSWSCWFRLINVVHGSQNHGNWFIFTPCHSKLCIQCLYLINRYHMISPVTLREMGRHSLPIVPRPHVEQLVAGSHSKFLGDISRTWLRSGSKRECNGLLM